MEQKYHLILQKKLLINPKVKITEVRKEGIYRVEKNIIPDEQFIIKIRNEETGEPMTAILEDKFLSSDQIKLLQQAEWQRKPIRLVINVRFKGYEPLNAYIVGIEEYKSE